MPLCSFIIYCYQSLRNQQVFTSTKAGRFFSLLKFAEKQHCFLQEFLDGHHLPLRLHCKILALFCVCDCINVNIFSVLVSFSLCRVLEPPWNLVYKSLECLICRPETQKGTNIHEGDTHTEQHMTRKLQGDKWMSKKYASQLQNPVATEVSDKKSYKQLQNNSFSSLGSQVTK